MTQTEIDICYALILEPSNTDKALNIKDSWRHQSISQSSRSSSKNMELKALLVVLSTLNFCVTFDLHYDQVNHYYDGLLISVGSDVPEVSGSEIIDGIKSWVTQVEVKTLIKQILHVIRREARLCILQAKDGPTSTMFTSSFLPPGPPYRIRNQLTRFTRMLRSE